MRYDTRVGTALGIFWHDAKQLLRNPFAFALVLCMIALSCAFAWYSIAAMWSPYQHTDTVRVAVVDNDEGENVKDIGDVDVGALVVDALGRDKSFAWEPVDESTGRAGLESGEYYAAIILPPNFTREYTSTLRGGTMGEPSIEYWVNQKYNPLAIESTDASAGSVDAVIESTFTAIVSDVVKGLAQNGAQEKSDSASKSNSRAKSNLADAAKSIKNVSDSFDKAEKSIEAWTDSVKAAQTSLDSLKASLPDLRTAVESGEKVLSDTREMTHTVNSSLSSVLVESGPDVVSTMEDISERVATVAGRIEGIEDYVSSLSETAQDALSSNEQAIAALKSIKDPSDEVEAALEILQEKNAELEASVNSLEDSSQKISETISDASGVADDATDDVDDMIENLTSLSGSFNTEVMPKLDTSMDAIALLLGSLSGTIDSLDVQITEAKGQLDDIGDMLSQTKDVLGQTSESLDAAAKDVEETRASLSAVADSEFVKKAAEFAGIDAKSYGEVMAKPVTTKVETVYAPNAYGSMTAPFFTNVAIWVFALMLVLVMKLEADPKLFAGTRPWQAYLGRLLLFVVLGLVQAAIVTAGCLVMGANPASPVAFICAGLMCAFAFVNVVFALSIVFKHVGKALAVVLLIVQIPGASNMFPTELLPDVLRSVHPLMPFTHGMGAMSEAIGGFYDGVYALEMLWLFGFALIALVIALLLRPQVLNVSRLMDAKPAIGDVFVGGEHALDGMARENALSAQAALTDGEKRTALERARSFIARYGKLRRAIPFIAVLVPIAAIAAMSLVNAEADGKVVLLLLFLGIVAALFLAIAALEYTHDNMQRQLKAASAANIAGRAGAWPDKRGMVHTSSSATVASRRAEAARRANAAQQADAPRRADTSRRADISQQADAPRRADASRRTDAVGQASSTRQVKTSRQADAPRQASSTAAKTRTEATPKGSTTQSADAQGFVAVKPLTDRNRTTSRTTSREAGREGGKHAASKHAATGTSASKRPGAKRGIGKHGAGKHGTGKHDGRRS